MRTIYEASPETVHTNITILVFNEIFDNQIGCDTGGVIVSRFDLKIITEYI